MWKVLLQGRQKGHHHPSLLRRRSGLLLCVYPLTQTAAELAAVVGTPIDLAKLCTVLTPRDFFFFFVSVIGRNWAAAYAGLSRPPKAVAITMPCYALCSIISAALRRLAHIGLRLPLKAHIYIVVYYYVVKNRWVRGAQQCTLCIYYMYLALYLPELFVQYPTTRYNVILCVMIIFVSYGCLKFTNHRQ